MNEQPQAAEIARNRWREIFPRYGITENFLVNRHGPCPVCGGKDRFRFDDKTRGRWFCNCCGSGDGFALLKLATGKPYKELADEVRAMCGAAPFNTSQKRLAEHDHDYRIRAMERVWRSSLVITEDSLAHKYLEARLGKNIPALGKSLRWHPALWHRYENKKLPAIIAKFASHERRAVNLHLTFLAGDGLSKADIRAPKLVMPGTLPGGGAVRLGEEYLGAERMGIAEGIETALSARVLFDLPVWAALNGNLLAKWTPPAMTREVVIFADNDPNYDGQAKAYMLANRLTLAGVSVAVMFPGISGQDWNDVLMAKLKGVPPLHLVQKAG